MRRPLCLVGLAFVTALLLGIHLLPHDPPDCGIPEGKTAAAVGRVGWKERRISGSEEVLVVTLEQVIILKPDQRSVLKQIIADSDTAFSNSIARDSVEKTETFLEKNRESLRREDAGEITGILCYLGGEDNPAMGSIVLVEGTFRPFAHGAAGQTDAGGMSV